MDYRPRVFGFHLRSINIKSYSLCARIRAPKNLGYTSNAFNQIFNSTTLHGTACVRTVLLLNNCVAGQIMNKYYLCNDRCQWAIQFPIQFQPHMQKYVYSPLASACSFGNWFFVRLLFVSFGREKLSFTFFSGRNLIAHHTI